MRYLFRLVTVLASVFGLLVGTPAVLAHASDGSGSGTHAVFVQTNDPAGNSIDVFARAANGGLRFVAAYPTGGQGGRAAGSAVDPLASQSSLFYDAADGLLLATNAGSDSVSVFGVSGTTLHLNQVIRSGGPFPTSIGVHGSIAYVLDAGRAGYVNGYQISGGQLNPIPGSRRSLSLDNSNPPFFLSAPAQVGFTPDGSHLVVTLKGNSGGSVDVFGVRSGGLLSANPTTTVVGGNAFAFNFNPAGQLALVNAGFGNLSTYTVNTNGSLTLVSAGKTDGQQAACWVTPIQGFYLVANAGSADLSEYTISRAGTVALTNAIAAGAIPGAIDMAASGHLLFAQSGGSGTVKSYVVDDTGTLSLIGSTTVPDGGSQEGIAAS